jgi:hypothetical protein
MRAKDVFLIDFLFSFSSPFSNLSGNRKGEASVDATGRRSDHSNGWMVRSKEEVSSRLGDQHTTQSGNQGALL